MTHDLVSLVAFSSGIMGCAVWAVVFRGDSRWTGLWKYSALTAGLALVFMLIMLTVEGATGVWQRMFVGSLFLWCAVVGVRLLVRGLSEGSTEGLPEGRPTGVE